MSGESAYQGLAQEMRHQAKAMLPPGMCVGVVKEYTAQRLVIQADGMALENDDLLVNADLCYDAVLTAPASYDGQLGEVDLSGIGAVSASVDCGFGSITKITLQTVSGSLSGTGTVQVTVKTRRLAVGDRVLLQPSADGQLYYVLCKVVSP